MALSSPPAALRDQAIAIWRAGVDAVAADRLVVTSVAPKGDGLVICGEPVPLSPSSQIVVVGGGKAGAGMAAGLMRALEGSPAADRVIGWINVPADTVRPCPRIHLHAARPAGVNEPTDAGVAGAARILDLAGSLREHDLCIVLLSGGGSALLPAPVSDITLEDKQQVTRVLMASPASIEEINAVRQQLSRIKGGGLARAAGAARIYTLIISDVIGDPLDVIASGPTVEAGATPADALRILRRYAGAAAPPRVIAYLEARARAPGARGPIRAVVRNLVIGNNAMALRAAATHASAGGFEVRSLGSENRGEARDVGRELAARCLTVHEEVGDRRAPVCMLSGGEPVVHLVETSQPRRGGRNQEVALAAIERLWDEPLEALAVLSGGTDGEDGPTDAAGAVADAVVIRAARALGLVPREFLAVNNAYPFFEQTGGLLRTGPTGTNVMDLRVALIDPRRTSNRARGA
jgi:glycerate-2-kinase